MSSSVSRIAERASPADRVDLSQRYRAVRRSTELLREPLSAEDCVVQSMDDASPTKWHLGHTTWFFETFVLESSFEGYEPFHPEYRYLFNSYYNTVGGQHPRPKRGLLSRPPLEDVVGYRAHVDRHMLALMEEYEDSAPADIIELGLNHEQQHQELILTDAKHMLSCNPLRPAYRPAAEARTTSLSPLEWHPHEEAVRWLGYAGDGFHFDNEGPRHRSFVRAFEIGSRCIANGEYLGFMNDGGYERPDLWLSDGWITRQRERWTSPLYWELQGGEWWQMTLSGLRELRIGEPVCHVSYYEADAYARWAGCRLPTEAEWETTATDLPLRGNFVEDDFLHPRPPDPKSDSAPAQLFGDVWEWTQSAYAPYPGFEAAEGALGEYNGKFMCNQMVLRGGSCATPVSHLRPTYRNFFYPSARWQFSGIRLARDLH